MKKFIVGSAIVLGLCAAAPAFASGGMSNPALKFANDYSRSIDHFELNGRTFLVQENPVTPLEIQTKIYWLKSQLLEQEGKELEVTY